MTRRSDLVERDAADPFRAMRDAFELPEGVIYLDGNSLGALPRATPARVADMVRQEWGRDLIGSWNSHDWIGAPQRLGAMIAPLVGAEPDEVVVADSTSVNLFKLMAAACQARPGRRVILSEPGNFPTDLYVAQGVAATLGVELRTVPADRIAVALDAEVACVLLTHVHYKSGYRHDMAAMTAAAHGVGALMLWDLSHSVGAVSIELDASGADLAVGCGYKYLNGGPGAPAFLYVARRHQETLRSPLSGWMGHAAPFAFDDGYAPAAGIDRFMCGTPPIVAMAALESGLALFQDLDRSALFAKGQALCSTFIELMQPLVARWGFTLTTPRDPGSRGSHVSYAHPEAYAICQALIARGVIGDFRAPDVVRLGFTPLYVGFQDVGRAVDILGEVMADRSWGDPHFKQRAKVT